MKKSNSLTNRSGLAGLVVFSLSVLFGVSSCKPDYDLDTHFPEWLGTSIYQTLQEGFEGYTFNYYVKLIDTLDQKKVLDKTGSKTLFVADDAAFERFFGDNCPFRKADGSGVQKFSELSIAQMKMILNGSMLNNVYQVAALSTTGGNDQTDPVVGNCMRRISASRYTDSIPIYQVSDLPDPKHNPYWDNVRDKTAGIPILQDGTIRPIVFFVNKFLEMNKLEDSDYDFLFNQGDYPLLHPTGRPARDPNEASVNGIRIAFQNKKCFNGFLHVMSDVVYLLPNMAEYLSSAPSQKKSSIYSSILERFSAPYANTSKTAEVRQLIQDGYLTSPALIQALEDPNSAVYVKRYFSENNQDYADGIVPLTDLPDGTPFDEQQSALRFDPGWNEYFTAVPGSSEENAKQLQHNMAVMLVPTDEAISEWWLKEAGVSLRERYGKKIYKDRDVNEMMAHPDWVADDMDSIPYKVISKLLNNNMLYSLVGSVPSKFESVLNDANDPMFEGQGGIKAAIESIDSVVMCCNGAIYFTNKVYAPTAYRSVSYPTLVNDKLDIINMAIENKTLSFSAYLNSMVSTYSFFVPVIRDQNDAEMPNKMVWIDPVSFPLANAGGNMHAIVFAYDPSLKTIVADWYNYDPDQNKIIGSSLQHLQYTAPKKLNDSETTESQIIMNRLGDLLDYHIITTDVESDSVSVGLDMNGYRYFQTKGRGTVRIKTVPNLDVEANLAQMEVAGGWQIEHNENVKVLRRYDLSKSGNGRTYLIDRPLFTSRKSAYDIVSDTLNYPEFKTFYKLMVRSQGRLNNSLAKNSAKKPVYPKDGKPLFATNSNSHAIGSDRCISTLNTYHYTLYVPTNESLDALLKAGVIYSDDSLDIIASNYALIEKSILDTLPNKGKTKGMAEKVYKQKLIELTAQFGYPVPNDSIQKVFIDNTKVKSGDYLKDLLDYERARLKNFLKFHIQDNSVYVNAPFNAGWESATVKAEWAAYETAFMDEGQFTRLEVSGGTDIRVRLSKTDPNPRKVLTNTSTGPTAEPLYNIMCREYEYNQGSITAMTTFSSKIETSSYVVIHQIDGPLVHPSILKRDVNLIQ